ncbi:MAG: uracil-DNA glycosylase [Proteobacteria bacterium]|nr:uracil-DNA glycosylase [Pseudomonadota bacterium]MBU1709684.1 uracil-DNA glycosylase [Pseudomonadota bacterium]
MGYHNSLGIDHYPRTPEIEQFLKNIGTEIHPAGKQYSHPGTVPFQKTITAEESPLLQAGDANLEAVREDLGDCKRCGLCETRTHLVFGEGNNRSGLMIIGEWPGIEDDLQNSPFSGEAGDLLTKMLAAINLDTKDVYLTQLVKCHTPGNRAPKPEEIATCNPFLLRQIAVLSPKVICTMGVVAAQTLLKNNELLIRLRGRFHNFMGALLMPTFHPKFLLENPEMKKATWIDLQMIQKKLDTT